MERSVQTLIQAVEQAGSAESLVACVRDLAAARQEAAIPTLVQVLSYNNPGAAVAAVEGLVALGEAAVSYLLENIDGYNYGARAWATRACGSIGDPRALALLLEAASSDFALSVRRAAARGLGHLQWEKLPVGERSAAQQQAVETLLLVSEDPEWVVRYAALVGLEALGTAGWRELVLARCRQLAQTDPELAVRARGRLVWQKLAD